MFMLGIECMYLTLSQENKIQQWIRLENYHYFAIDNIWCILKIEVAGNRLIEA